MSGKRSTKASVGEPTVDETESGDVSWRELAVARSLDSARTRAESRVDRFIEAALTLLETNAGKDFTVQQVVEASGQSLRSFYQYFDGKHELLLTLFEESIRTTVAKLETVTSSESDPLERLHVFVVEYYRLCRPAAPKAAGSTASVTSPILVEFAQQLLTERPTEAARAFRPLVALFGTLLDEAADTGVIRADLNRRRIAGVVLESIMFNTFSATIAGASVATDVMVDAEEFWAFVVGGLGAEPAGTKKKQR